MYRSDDFDVLMASRRLRDLRQGAGVTFAKLAEATGISEQTLKNFEKVARNADQVVPDPIKEVDHLSGMSIARLYVIARFFNVSADYLLGISDTQSVDCDTRAACETTGLPEEVIAKIRQLHEGVPFVQPKVMHDLIMSAHFLTLMHRIDVMTTSLKSANEICDKVDTNSTSLTPGDFALAEELPERFLFNRYSVEDAFRELLADMTQYKNTEKRFEALYSKLFDLNLARPIKEEEEA